MKSHQIKILDLANQYNHGDISEYVFIEQVDGLVLNAHSERSAAHLIESISSEFKVPKNTLNQLHLNGLLQGLKIGRVK